MPTFSRSGGTNGSENCTMDRPNKGVEPVSVTRPNFGESVGGGMSWV